jgi:hypothetical protein
MKRFILSVLALSVVAGLLTSTVTSNAQEGGLSRLLRIRNGDLNGDGTRDISDMIAGLQWLYHYSDGELQPF